MYIDTPNITGSLNISSVANAGTDTDKFVVLDSGVVKYRTGAEVLSDIGAAPSTGGNYLPLAGGTVTGDLTTNGVFTIQNATPYIQWKNVAGTRLGYIQHDATNLVMSADVGEIQLNTTANNDILINPGGTGKVGIGITAPSEKLEVDGNVQIGQTTDAKLYMVSTGGNGNNERFFIEGYADGGTYGGGFRLQTRNDSNIFNPAVSVNRNGNVGIGTTDPTAPLHVIGTVRMGNTNEGLTFTAGSGIGNIIGVDTGFAGYNAIALKASANTGIYLDTADNVGIGTNDPATRLDVNGIITLRRTNEPDPTSDLANSAFIRHDGALKFVVNGGTNTNYGLMRFITRKGDGSDPIEAMRVNSSGSISALNAFNVNGNFMANGGASVANGLNVFGDITATGDVTAFSDERVKENIHTIPNALEITNKLRGVTYNRTDLEDKSEKIGVIAQEVQKILPQVVNEQEDGMLGVSYGNLTAVLIEAIKEQQKQIEELKNKVYGTTD